MLDARKQRILEAIVLDYIASAEPVGSRTISKKYNLGISSATIRNEMADLEEMGMIVQPHTSAGRVPSDSGYRYYVDYLMKRSPQEYAHVKAVYDAVREKSHQMEGMVDQVLKVITDATQYTAMLFVGETGSPQARLQLLQLLHLADGKALMVVVNDAEQIENVFLDIPQEMNKYDLEVISEIFNQHLRGLTLTEWSPALIEHIYRDLREQRRFAEIALTMLASILEGQKDAQFVLNGTLNMLKQPEFQEMDKARRILGLFHEAKDLQDLLARTAGDTVQIRIGTEHELSAIEDCSVLVASYKVGDQNIGRIGLLGPKRMDYARSVAILDAVIHGLEEG